MLRPKRWKLAPASAAAGELASRLKTSPVIAQILLNRGLAEAADCLTFLSPSLKHLHDPASLPNLPRAAERIAKAIRDGEKVVIYGDYDVDGITGTATLWHAIKLLGGQVDYYIPHRIEEGYGINSEAIGQICEQGAKLIVSVDCGITAVEPAKIAAERGVDMIVTDHHDWHADASGQIALPACYTVVHPRLRTDGSQPYGNPYLCGSGVAFKLAWGIGQAHSGATRVSEAFRDFLCEATALAALGTIADVVPLVGENRTLAHFGLGGLKASKLRGLRALIASAGLTGQDLDSYHVGYLLAPRLNACGRMGHARLAVEMLTDADDAKAGEIAAYLEQQNKARQDMEKRILAEALEQVTQRGYDSEDCPAIVLAGAGWHAGVIGIVAARIVDRFHRPAIMIAMNDGQGQGSARSISGFHLAKALEACHEHLVGYGGHEMAAGLRLSADKLDGFRDAFCGYAKQALAPEMLIPELRLECLAELNQITEALVHDLERLGPFGVRNPRPLLCCQQVEVAATPRRVGKSNDHLQLTVRQGRSTMKCIAWRMGPWADRLKQGSFVDLAVEPTINEFNGYRNVQLEVKDMRVG